MAVIRPHLALNVSDLDRSVSFYEALFGVPPAKRRPGYAKFEIASPLLNLSLNEGEGPVAGGTFNHAGIQVESTEDVLGAKARLVDAGLATFDEMDTTCCYAKQDKIWVRDPDGAAWEIFVVHADADEAGDSRADDDDCDCGETGCACAATGAESVCCA